MKKIGIVAILLAAFAAFILIGPSADGGGVTEVAQVGQAQMLEKIASGNAVLIDIRSNQEVAQGAIPGSVHLSIDQISENMSLLDPYEGKQLIFYCKSGGRVKRLTNRLQASSHPAKERLAHLKGDYSGWVSAGRDVE